VRPGGNVQPRGGSYGGRGRQIMQRWGDNGGGYRGGNQLGPRRDLNAIDVDRNRGGDRKCYNCGGCKGTLSEAPVTLQCSRAGVRGHL